MTAVDCAAKIFRAYFESCGIRWIQQRIEQSPPLDMQGCADMVCMCEVIEHLPGDILKSLEHACSMLKPNGFLFITTPNLRSISGLFSLIVKQVGLATKPDETVRMQYERARSKMRYFGHIREYTRKEIVDLVESCGMKYEQATSIPPYKRDNLRDRLIWWTERCIPSWRVNQQLIFRKLL